MYRGMYVLSPLYSEEYGLVLASTFYFWVRAILVSGFDTKRKFFLQRVGPISRAAREHLAQLCPASTEGWAQLIHQI